MAALSLLLLSGGGHTGANIMATLAGRRDDLRLIATSDSADEPTLFAFDAIYLAPALAAAPQDFAARVLEIMEHEAVDLVIPCRDEDVTWLADLRQRRPELAPRLLCGAHGIAEQINDKWLSCALAREHDLPFAHSLPTGGGADVATFIADVGLPVVLKPRHDANSRGVYLLSTAAQVTAAMARPDAVLQEFLGEREATLHTIDAMLKNGVALVHDFMGAKHSIQLLLAPGGECCSIACTINTMDGRISRRVSLDPSPQAREIGARCAEVFGRADWRGPLNVQCQMDAHGRLKIHEFNARFTGATASRWVLGIDEVGLALECFTGHRLSPPSRAEVSPTWARESFVARAAGPQDVDILRRDGVWCAKAGGR